MSTLIFIGGAVTALCCVFVWAAVIGIIRAKDDASRTAANRDVMNALMVANLKRERIADALNRIADAIEKEATR